jgi:type II secretory pathway component PulF
MGKSIAGAIDAPNMQMAGERLYQLGYFPITVEEGRDKGSFDISEIWRRFQKVKLEELIFFSHQLSTLYKAGLPLLAGLGSLAEQTENKKLKPILEAVRSQIEEGSTLFEAMSKYPEVFPLVYVNMVRAGETSGRLGESLDRFITHAEREIKTRQRVKEATRYPKIVIVSLAIAFGILIIFVIPRFAEIYAQFKTTLPLPTRMMIQINTIFHIHWYLVCTALVGIPLLIRNYLRTEKGRYSWDRLKIRIPVFGPLLLKIALSRFSFTFVMLNRSGIPILQTLEITASTINNVHLAQSITEIMHKVREGRSLSDALEESEKFTPLVIQMVAVGESSGTLDEMLMRITEYYDIEADNAIKKLSTYIEPALVLFLGVVVLFLALAVFLPWWNMAALFR